MVKMMPALWMHLLVPSRTTDILQLVILLALEIGGQDVRDKRLALAAGVGDFIKRPADVAAFSKRVQSLYHVLCCFDRSWFRKQQKVSVAPDPTDVNTGWLYLDECVKLVKQHPGSILAKAYGMARDEMEAKAKAKEQLIGVRCSSSADSQARDGQPNAGSQIQQGRFMRLFNTGGGNIGPDQGATTLVLVQSQGEPRSIEDSS